MAICCHVDCNFADKYSVIEPVSMLTNCTLITDRLKVSSGCRTVLKLCTLENEEADVGYYRTTGCLEDSSCEESHCPPIAVIVNHHSFM